MTAPIGIGWEGCPYSFEDEAKADAEIDALPSRIHAARDAGAADVIETTRRTFWQRLIDWLNGPVPGDGGAAFGVGPWGWM